MTNSVKNAFTKSFPGSGLIDSLANSTAASLNPIQPVGPYLTGGRAIIKINDRLFGFAFGVTFNINTDYVENNTIDEYLAYELMPTRITVNGTLSMFHIPNKSPTKRLIQPNVLSYLFHRYVTIEITDQHTGQTIFHTKKAVITSKQQVLQAGEISTIQLSWKAIGWVDEMIPSQPLGAGAPSFFSGKNVG